MGSRPDGLEATRAAGSGETREEEGLMSALEVPHRNDAADSGDKFTEQVFVRVAGSP
jgi:hypothetical protein